MKFSRVLLAGALLGMTQSAMAADFRAIVGYESTAMKGWVQDGTTRIEVVDDLNLDDSSVALLGFQLGALGQRLSFRYLPYSFSGTNTITRNINFGGQSFAASDAVTTTLDMTEYALDYRFVPLNTPIGHLGAGIGVNVFETDVELKTTNDTATSTGTLPLVTVGVTAGLKFPMTDFSVNGDYSMMKISDNRYSNLELNLDYKPFPLVAFRLGYRDRNLELDVDDLKADFSMSGPFVAVWVGL